MPRVSKYEVWSAIMNAKALLDKAARLVDTWLQQDTGEEEFEKLRKSRGKKKGKR